MTLEEKLTLLKKNKYTITETIINAPIYYNHIIDKEKLNDNPNIDYIDFDTAQSTYALLNEDLDRIYDAKSYEDIIKFIDKTDIRTLVDKNYMKLEDKLQILNNSDFKIRESLSNVVVHFDYPRIEEKIPPEPTTPADMYLDACHTSYQLLNNKNEIIYTNKVYANIIDYIDKNDINIILNNLK